MPSAFEHGPAITVPASNTTAKAAVIWSAASNLGESTIILDSGGNGRIGIAGDLDTITITSGVVTIAGELSATTLDIGGTNITSTAAELNLLDGVSGLVQADLTKLAAIDSTAAEINLLDALDRGSILYGNSSGVTTVLGQGGADQVLTSDGTDISWEDAGGGGTTHTTGSTNVHVVNDATTGVTLNNNYKFTMTMPSSGEGFFFKCADQGSEQSAVYYADYSSQITKIAGGSKWDVLDGGDTGGCGVGIY